MNKYVQKVLGELKAKQPWEKEFLQAAEEVLSSLTAVIDADPLYEQNSRSRKSNTLPSSVGGRQGRDTCKPRLPRTIQQRHRPLQGRLALPPVRKPRHSKIPRF